MAQLRFLARGYPKDFRIVVINPAPDRLLPLVPERRVAQIVCKSDRRKNGGNSALNAAAAPFAES